MKEKSMLRKSFLLAACALLPMTLIAATPVKKSKPAAENILPFHATEKTLANGLKVIVVPTGLPNIVSLQIPVQTGSRNEVEPGKSGFAHFFEHIMFRGTPSYPPDKYNAVIQKAGRGRTPSPATTSRTSTPRSRKRTWRRSWRSKR